MALPPGPPLSPLLQTYYWIRRPLPFLRECRARYGDLFTMRVVNFGDVVQCADPEIIKDVFTGDPEVLRAGQANRVLRPFLGAYSLLVLDGAEHQRQRRLMMPAFHGERMHAYGEAMVAVMAEEMARWRPGEAFALQPRLQAVTLQVIMRTVFGLSEGERARRLSQLLSESLELMAWPGMLLPIMQRDFGPLRVISPWSRFQRRVREAEAVLRAEVDRRERRAREAGEVGADVLSMLLAARDEQGQPMRFAEVRDELITLLVAGHETTATALSWALLHLLREPAALQRLREEVTASLEAGEVVPERVARLPYLDAAVRETLRLSPVVPLVGRVLQRPLQVRGYELPAGAVLAPSIYLTQRRADLYPEPDRFVPDRFLSARPGPAEWLPFGGGTRRCIGAAFAQYEMKMVLATLLSRARLTLCPGQRGEPKRRSVTLAPASGVRVVMN